MFSMQHTGNRRLVRACARCSGFVGLAQGQLETIFSEERFMPLVQALKLVMPKWDAEMQALMPQAGASPVQCAHGCGEWYCSAGCRDAHWQHNHNLLCTGAIQSEDHPLIRFKYHALEHADTLLLAAQVLAHLVNRAKAAGGPAALPAMVQELLGFCHAPFGQACRAPPGGVKDEAFLVHTNGLLEEAARLLRDAFVLHSPVEAQMLFEQGGYLLSEIMGLFEYNNIDVDIASPVAAFFQKKAEALLPMAGSDPLAAQELAAIDRLLREKECVMRFLWNGEATGIFDDDDEDDDDMDEGCGEDECELDDGEITDKKLAEMAADVQKLSFQELLAAPWPSLHGTALFLSVARLNHSCEPSLRIDFPDNCASLAATVLRPIAAGEELKISYIRQEADVQKRRQQLLEYGFACDCPRCQQEEASSFGIPAGATRTKAAAAPGCGAPRAQRRLK